jgi:hypothetical protein
MPLAVCQANARPKTLFLDAKHNSPREPAGGVGRLQSVKQALRTLTGVSKNLHNPA